MIGIVGAGAFGTALACTLAREGRDVTVWARDLSKLTSQGRQSSRLPGVDLPKAVSVTAEIRDLAGAEAVLLCLPMQALAGFLNEAGPVLDGTALVACCKGVDLNQLKGASSLLRADCPKSTAAILTGPSFATDIALGKPTALTLACAGVEAEGLQRLLSTATLRIYRSSDVIGAELGGALKNVIAIAAGVVIGAGLGESARAALMTRGYAEMLRFALYHGARAETLAGLSGFGDLVLTCTSLQSRNLRFGMALGAAKAFDPSVTVEGMATAKAVARIAGGAGLDMPISSMVAALVDRKIALDQAIRDLMSRPLKEE